MRITPIGKLIGMVLAFGLSGLWMLVAFLLADSRESFSGYRIGSEPWESVLLPMLGIASGVAGLVAINPWTSKVVRSHHLRFRGALALAAVLLLAAALTAPNPRMIIDRIFVKLAPSSLIEKRADELYARARKELMGAENFPAFWSSDGASIYSEEWVSSNIKRASPSGIVYANRARVFYKAAARKGSVRAAFMHGMLLFDQGRSLYRVNAQASQEIYRIGLDRVRAAAISGFLPAQRLLCENRPIEVKPFEGETVSLPVGISPEEASDNCRRAGTRR